MTFEEAEAQWYADEQARVDGVRAQGYLVVSIDRVHEAREELEQAVDAIMRARDAARRAREYFTERLLHAERIARLIAAGESAAIARALETMEDCHG